MAICLCWSRNSATVPFRTSTGCFCIEGAQGKTLRFRFPEDCVGYFGAAVSRDLHCWKWSGSADGDGNGFCYAFSADEDRVYFCHDMRYAVERFDNFARVCSNLTRFPFATSRHGREVPGFVAGEGERWLVLASRRHSCESTGTYVLEGAVAEYLRHPLPGVRLLAVPFMDMDGVQEGDPGKCRRPHDHNRDYAQGLYPEVRAMMDFGRTHRIAYFLDLHSPWHMGGRNDTVFIITPGHEMEEPIRRLGGFLSREAGALYDPANTMPWNTEWNIPTPPDECPAAQFFGALPGVRYSTILETAYFGTKERPMDEERLLFLGGCLMRALRQMVKGEETIC